MASSKAERAKQLETLVRTTHFDEEEIGHMQEIFAIQADGEKIDRNGFREILLKSFKMTDDTMMDRVFRAFSATGDNLLAFGEFAEGMSVFLRGSIDEHIQFCFVVYDLNGDNHLTREEISHLLRQTVVKSQSEEDKEEAVKDLVDLVMKRMDHDRDGRISMADYETTVKADELMLEAFGQCLPQPKMIDGFLSASAFDLYY